VPFLRDDACDGNFYETKFRSAVRRFNLMSGKASTLVRVLPIVAGIMVAGISFIWVLGATFHRWLVTGPKLQAGTNWIPAAVGGPMEIRPLPPAQRLQADFVEWVAASPGERVRLYELVIASAASQLNFRHAVRWGKTPLGRVPSTYVEFDYADPTNGLYRVVWREPGEQSDGWLRCGEKPRRLLVQPRNLKTWPLPEVYVVAIEGVQAFGCLVAVDDLYLLTTASNQNGFRLLQETGK
jgi:hypothetical protein